jgi:hypothetical protein
MINEIRNTVLAILNKNNYGYISPSDFNLFAQKAQMELFDEYFSQYNKAVNMENSRLAGTDYADIKKKISENIEVFSRFDYLQNYSSNKFYLPSIITTGYNAYMVTKVLVYPVELSTGSNTSVSSGQLVDTSATFIFDGVTVDDTVVNIATGDTAYVIAVVSETTLTLSSNIFTTSPVAYKVVDIDSVNEAEKVNHQYITLLNKSLQTAPSHMFPAYTQEDGLVSIYPKDLNYTGRVAAQYFRFPTDPKWTYITLFNGQAVFDQSQPDYQDFEIAQEDDYKLTMKILQYCGISIRENEIVTFGMAQEQHEQPTFSQQE